MNAELVIEAASTGDRTPFLTLHELALALAGLPTADRDRGTIDLIVRRGLHGRETPERLMLTPQEGISGDAWNRKEGATLETQVTVMQTGVAELIANGRPLTLSATISSWTSTSRPAPCLPAAGCASGRLCSK